MAARQRIYKIDVRELEKDIALFIVAGDEKSAQLIYDFCQAYSIALDKATIAEHTDTYKLIAERLAIK